MSPARLAIKARQPQRAPGPNSPRGQGPPDQLNALVNLCSGSVAPGQLRLLQHRQQPLNLAFHSGYAGVEGSRSSDCVRIAPPPGAEFVLSHPRPVGGFRTVGLVSLQKDNTPTTNVPLRHLRSVATTRCDPKCLLNASTPRGRRCEHQCLTDCRGVALVSILVFTGASHSATDKAVCESAAPHSRIGVSKNVVDGRRLALVTYAESERLRRATVVLLSRVASSMPLFILVATPPLLRVTAKEIKRCLPQYWTLESVELGEDGWSKAKQLSSNDAVVGLAVGRRQLLDIGSSSELTKRLLELKACKSCTTILIRPADVTGVVFTSRHGAIDGYVLDSRLSVCLPRMLVRLDTER